MKFAFAAESFPQSDLNSLAVRCRELGFDGVELPVTLVANGDVAQIRQAFDGSNVEIACLVAKHTMPDRPNDLIAALDLAALLRCRFVKIPGPTVARHHSRIAVGNEFALWLAPIAKAATERKVMLLIENGPSLQSARELWLILESLDQSSVGVYWSLASAVSAGESPFVSIPTLNSKIRYVRISGVNAGTSPVEAAIKRLLGIGYAGFITVDERSDGNADESLKGALVKLKQWSIRPVVKKHVRAAAH